MRRIALLAPLAVLLLAGSSGAGNYMTPPGDCCPQWSPHGTQLAFTANRGRGPVVGAVAAAGGAEQIVPGIPVGIRSPDWASVAYEKGDMLAVSRVDGSGERLLARTYFTGVAWSPDSKRLAFVAADRSLRTIGVDGTDTVTLAPAPADSPVWIPDGHLLAYVRETDTPSVHVVWSDGRGDATVEPDGRADVGPVWSPDGRYLAYWSSDSQTAQLKVVRIGGNGGSVSFAIPGAVTNGAIIWAPDSRVVYGTGLLGLVGFDLDTGRQVRTIVGIPNGVISPDGRQIAYTSGGECRDRVGVYLANIDGSRQRRVSNSCRIVGTGGPDSIHADFSRVVLGLGGDDMLYADDTYYYFDGNTLYGGAGNDQLVGGYGQDILDGGPGNDTITGGPSKDLIVGGPGHDRLSGDGGSDTIYARDGERDRISCGTNTYGEKQKDLVYADKVDVVASDCEVVHRR